MRKLQLTISTTLLLLFAGFALRAQPQFKARLSETTVGQRERFTLTFSIDANAHSFEAPDLSEFRILGGPNRSQSTRIVNYEMSVESSYSYILMPKQTGSFTIGSATVISDGEKYRSEPVTINVTRESPRRNDPNDPYNRAAESAFVRVLASKTSVYRGEPVVASYKLYFNTDVSSPKILSEPDFTGFYREEIAIDRVNTQPESYRGKNYTTGVIRQMVLIPQRSGSITPGEVEVQIPTQVPSNRRDIFNRRLSQTVNQTSAVDFPTLQVKPLPEAGRPDNFSGAVGRYQLSVELSRNELNADESLTVTVKLSGTGNIKLVDAPKPEVPSAFEIFDPKISENIRVSGAGMSGSRSYEYLLVPRYGGTYKIPPIKFSYFNPANGRYTTLSSDELSVKVKGAPAQPGAVGGPSAAGKEKVDFINKEILFIKTDPGELSRPGRGFFGSTAFYGSLSLIGFALIGLFIAHNIRGKRQNNLSALRRQKASKVARKHLSVAKKHLDKNENEAFYLALSNALWGYFADKLAIPQSQLSKELIARKLKERGISAEDIESLQDSMNRAEMARYSGIGRANPSEDYQKAALLLTKIDRQL